MTQFERDIQEGNAPGREGHGRELNVLVFVKRDEADNLSGVVRLYESWDGCCSWCIHQVRPPLHSYCGVFMLMLPPCSYDVSPMKVVHTETRQSFAHFLTSSVPVQLLR